MPFRIQWKCSFRRMTGCSRLVWFSYPFRPVRELQSFFDASCLRWFAGFSRFSWLSELFEKVSSAAWPYGVIYGMTFQLFRFVRYQKRVCRLVRTCAVLCVALVCDWAARIWGVCFGRTINHKAATGERFDGRTSHCGCYPANNNMCMAIGVRVCRPWVGKPRPQVRLKQVIVFICFFFLV